MLTTTTTIVAEPEVMASPRGLVARLSGEALRYLAASVAALALDTSLLWLTAGHLGVPVWLAGGIGYLAGLVLIYQLSVRWVFRTRVVRNAKAEFVLFAALGVFGLVLNSITLTVATSLGLALPFAKGVSAGIGFVANFAGRKALLFTRRSA